MEAEIAEFHLVVMPLAVEDNTGLQDSIGHRTTSYVTLCSVQRYY